jgi:uncharacterized repeat protein (TIGR03803 family)
MVIASFNGSDGSLPLGRLIEDSQGDLFGTAQLGGADNAGVVFEIVAGSDTITDLASFSGANGAVPQGLVEDSRGNFFGTAYSGGGANSNGTVFEVAAGSDTITTLASFDGSDGASPTSGVIEDSQGDRFALPLTLGSIC